MQPQMHKPGRVEMCGDSDGCLVRFHPDTLHDLSGPVNQLSTMLALFQKRYRTTPDGDDDVIFGMIQAAAGRLRSLMGGLQAYTRVVDAPGPHRLCEVESLLAAAVSSLGAGIRESGAVITHGKLPQLNCEPNQIVHALASLIDNSIKFRSESRPEIHLSAEPDEHEWVFSVRDNGIGVDPKHGERIFHLFKRLNGDKYAGAGIGLAICRAILARHDGRIWLETPSGGGATFVFTLPSLETI